jgi:predicted dehydrogenase
MMKNTKKIGYAVLGLGIGMAHAEAAAASENAELVALCDLDEARLQKAAALYPSATLYTDAKALFAVKTRYTPDMNEDERTQLQRGWHRAVERAKGWQE